MSGPEYRRRVDQDTIDPRLAADFQRLVEANDPQGLYKRDIVLQDPEFGRTGQSTTPIGAVFPLAEGLRDFLVVFRNGRVLVVNDRNVEPPRRGHFQSRFAPSSKPLAYASEQHTIDSVPRLFSANQWTAADSVSKTTTDAKVIREAVKHAVTIAHGTLNAHHVRLAEQRTPFFYEGQRPVDILGPERHDAPVTHSSGFRASLARLRGRRPGGK